MTTVLTAEAIIKAKDATGGVFAAIANKISQISRTAANASRAVTGATQKAPMIDRVNASVGRSQMAVAAASARVLAPAALAYGGAQAFKRFASTDMAITRIGITAEATEGEIEGLRKSLRDLAFSTGKPFDEVTAGLDSLVASGQSLGDAMKVLPSITRTAQASGSAIADISNTAVALQQSLDIRPDKLQDAFDVLNVAGKSGKFELKDLARYMASIGPAAKAAGFSGEEGLKKLAAMMETIRAGTGTSEEAADSMINILQKMESSETANKFEKMGVDLPKGMAKARKEGRNLVEAFVDLAKVATKGDLSKLPQLIGDLQFARGARALMSYGDVYEDVMKRINASKGSTMGDLEKVLARPKVAIDKLSESWDRLKESAGAAIAAMGAAGGLNKLSKVFEDTSDYYAKSEAEKARFQAEKRRREQIDPQVWELEQKIETEERAEKTKTGPTWFERTVQGKKEIAPLDDRLRNSPLLQQLRRQLFDLKASRDVEMPGGETPLMSETEIKAVLDEAERKRIDALPPEGKTATSKRKTVPLPTKDPRYPMQLPQAGDDAEGIPPAKPAASAATRAPAGPAPDLTDVWSKGANAVEHLDGSAQAAGAGKATGAAFNTALGAQLSEAVSLVQRAVQQMQQSLNFSASPSITPKIGPVPSGQRASLDTMSAKHAQFSDGTNFG